MLSDSLTKQTPAEVKQRFLDHKTESDLQRKERLQSQWMNLYMAKGEKHSAFKVKFWRSVLEMKLPALDGHTAGEESLKYNTVNM